jgi:hypothetical protein
MDLFLFSQQNIQLIDAHKLNYELVASWTVELGDLDQALHLWRYKGGFSIIDNAKKTLAQNKVSLLFKPKRCSTFLIVHTI